MQNITKLRDAAAVTRWHTMRTLRSQTLAEHSFGVAQLALYIHPKSSSELLSACLWHDLPELVTGDVPAYVKWDSPELKMLLLQLEQPFVDEHKLNTSNLKSKELKVLRWCDGMELVLWCLEELALGNRHADIQWAIEKTLANLSKEHPTDKAEKLYEQVSKRYTNRRQSLQRASL